MASFLPLRNPILSKRTFIFTYRVVDTKVENRSNSKVKLQKFKISFRKWVIFELLRIKIGLRGEENFLSGKKAAPRATHASLLAGLGPRSAKKS